MSKKGKATTYYSWDGNLCVFDSSTDFSDSVMYIPLNGEIVAQVGRSRGDGEAVSPAESEPVRFYHTDALGSVLALSGKNGNVLARYSYEPYGAIRHQEGSESSANTFVGAYGVRNDTNAGYYMVNRYYEGRNGIFSSSDPKYGNKYLKYLYSSNNPIVYIDPDGLAEFSVSPWPGVFPLQWKSTSIGYGSVVLPDTPIDGAIYQAFTVLKITSAELKLVNSIDCPPGCDVSGTLFGYKYIEIPLIIPIYAGKISIYFTAKFDKPCNEITEKEILNVVY